MSLSVVQALLKQHLPTAKCERTADGASGGCISDTCAFDTDVGKVFVKINTKSGAELMFNGEYSGLQRIAATNTLRVPRSLAVIVNEQQGGALLVIEHFRFASSQHNSQAQHELGMQLARLHSHNPALLAAGDPAAVRRFGFDVPTCCGYLPQDNAWHDDWLEFFTVCRLQHQIDLLPKKSSGAVSELSGAWAKLRPLLPKLFAGCDSIQPSLLHGDLWSGNYSFADGQPVAFDCASFYGHHEYEFGIVTMFGGFSQAFYTGYHSVLPRAPGFDDRVQLYQLFHQLNHWNHFGGGYASASLSIVKHLLDVCQKL